VINIGGRKVHPMEIEEALLRHDQVGDAVCVGIPDPLTGEAVCAFLVAKRGQTTLPSAEALGDFLRARLEQYKVPIAFEWVGAIPRNASGKVERKTVAGLLGRSAVADAPS
jgi:acyl-coenzyme A synthetase/AMP-(fatty) acid ligase